MKSLLLFLFCSFPAWGLLKSPRIINGKLASAGQFPYAASIQYKTENDEEKFCGGTLFNNQWILTAAHCVVNIKEFDIYLGVTNLEENVPITTSVSVWHSSYNPNNLENNIAAIKLPEPLVFSDYIRPIDFLSSERVSSSVKALVLGWGHTSEGASAIFNHHLYYAEVATISNSECMQTFGAQIKNSMICTTGDNNEGTCKGDSGGPLIQITSDNKSVLIGIANFYSGRGCESGDPSGFVRTFEYLDWIEEVTTTKSNDTTTPTPGSSPVFISSIFLLCILVVTLICIV